MSDTRVRKRGIPLDPTALDRACLLRGVLPGQVRKASGVSYDTFARVRRGLPVDGVTLQKIADALEQFPVRPALEEVAGSGCVP